MSNSIIAFACAAVLGAVQLPAADSKAARIEELFRLTKMDEMQKQTLEQTRKMMAGQIMQNVPETDRERARELQNKIMDMVEQRLSWDKMKLEYLKVYDEMFTVEELDAIITFYRSPAGRSMLEKMPQVMARSMALGQERMKDLMPEIVRLSEEAKKKQ